LDKIMFNFFGRKLQGQLALSHRNIIVQQYLDSTILGEMIGRLYVEKYFDKTSKNLVQDMIERLKHQMKESIKNLRWMSDKTKERAYAKIKTFKSKIGYPEKWREHTEIINIIINIITNGPNNYVSKKDDIPSAKMLDIVCEIRLYEYKTDILNIINKNRDDNKWSMNVHEVNAYYDPHRNEIVFPAGILQNPFFDKKNSAFKNYGFIGAIIGHEIIHGFDDQGRKYDHNGNTVNWWSDNDLKHFVDLTDKLVKQYEGYYINGRPINGRLTLGENIADLGGVILAYRSMMEHCSEKNITVTLVGIREFFKSYATIWCRVSRPEKTLMKILSDPHSPDKYRVYILRNLDAFYHAFADKTQYIDGCPDNIDHKDVMYLPKESRVTIW
jgi:predicted metalloendopeptidase